MSQSVTLQCELAGLESKLDRMSKSPIDSGLLSTLIKKEVGLISASLESLKEEIDEKLGCDSSSKQLTELLVAVDELKNEMSKNAKTAKSDQDELRTIVLESKTRWA